MTAAPQLKKAGLSAAREARAVLAAMSEGPEIIDPALSEELASVIGALFGAEVGNERQVHVALETATQRLQTVLEELDGARQPTVARGLSRALAMMHAAKEELGRHFVAAERSDATAPFLLESARVKESEPTDHERREMIRSELVVEVGLSGDTRFFAGVTGDLSPGGLFVATDDPLAVGTELDLAFVLPDGYRVSAIARVAWVRAPRYRPDELPAGMGVHFEALSDKDVRAIQYFLAQRPAFRYGG